MTQTLALLVDAYRDLNARKMFWITLILSGLVMVAFALVGISGTDLTLAGLHIPVNPMEPITVYKMVFSYVVIGVWLTWAAIVLALISTAGIFPDLISGGTIDLYLSKPISRARLFLVKYLTGLLFVALQVSVFSVGSFLVFGTRVHEWRPALFSAVPLVVCMFSYLYGFCVLLGVWTRSTIAAILLTVLVWVGFWGVQKADASLLSFEVLLQRRVDSAHRTIADADARKGHGGTFEMFNFRSTLDAAQRKQAVEALPGLEKNLARFKFFHKMSSGIKAVIPKTTETNDLLDRYLFSDEELDDEQQNRMDRRRQHRENAGFKNDPNAPFGADQDTVQATGSEVRGIVRSRSPWYIIGTSLASEAVVVTIAGWVFCRRDY